LRAAANAGVLLADQLHCNVVGAGDDLADRLDSVVLAAVIDKNNFDIRQCLRLHALHCLCNVFGRVVARNNNGYVHVRLRASFHGYTANCISRTPASVRRLRLSCENLIEARALPHMREVFLMKISDREFGEKLAGNHITIGKHIEPATKSITAVFPCAEMSLPARNEAISSGSSCGYSGASCRHFVALIRQ
jgi:hypothetical protein